MNRKELHVLAILVAVCVGGSHSVPAEDQTIGQQVSILEERLSKLRADVDALQVNEQQIQQDIKQLQAQLGEARQSGPSASVNDLQALEARVKALDAAREADKKAIIDQLAKELAAMSGSRGAAPTQSSGTVASNEYTVQKGDTLTSIAKNRGVSVAELRKANSLTSDSLKVGQKLVIPSK